MTEKREDKVSEWIRDGRIVLTFDDEEARTVVRCQLGDEVHFTVEASSLPDGWRDPVWTFYSDGASTVMDVEGSEFINRALAKAGLDVTAEEMLSLLRDPEWYLRVAQPLPGPLVSPLAEGEKMIEDEHRFWIRVDADAPVPPGARVVPAEEVINFTADTDPGF